VALQPAWKERFGVATVSTLGARGALVLVAGNPVGVPPPAVSVVDTTGAGDALAGWLAAALDRGATLRDAVALGVHAGSQACTYAGAQRPA
jgi:ribokinase